MTVSLPQRLETIVEAKVMSGLYPDAEAVLEEALRLLEERDRFERLRAELAIGIEQIERGDTVPYTPDFFDRLKREAAEHVRLGKPIKDAVKP